MKDKKLSTLPKIALVKQDVYDDLYVCPKGACAKETLLSSSCRVGPIGLIAELKADFYIIKEEEESECKIYQKVNPAVANIVYRLKSQSISSLPGYEFRKPGTDKVHADFAVSADAVDWGQYDIVISINISIPTRIVKRHPRVLWAYMIGEANMKRWRDPYGIYPRFGYDLILNQCARGKSKPFLGVADFPYTFLNSSTLEVLIYNHLKRPSKNTGIYVEVNSCPERPVLKRPKSFTDFDVLDMPYYLHEQKIGDNLQNLYDAKYFVKLGGRFIRGNSIIEAISSGTLVIMNPNEVLHKELLPPETCADNIKDIKALIEKLESEPDLYSEYLFKQRLLLNEYIFEKPLSSLMTAFIKKFSKN